MYLIGNTGNLVNAECNVEIAERRVDVLVSSSGGGQTEKSLNPEYNELVELIFHRLDFMRAAFSGAFIESAKHAALELRERRLELQDVQGNPAPNHNFVKHFGARYARIAIGRAAKRFGREQLLTNVDGGNSQKRVRLRFQLSYEASHNDVISVLQAIDAPRPTNKYFPIYKLLTESGQEQIVRTLGELSNMVEGLPPSAETPQFWANTREHQLQRKDNWFKAGYEASYLPESRSVRFVKSGKGSDRLSSSDQVAEHFASLLRVFDSDVSETNNQQAARASFLESVHRTVRQFNRSQAVQSEVLNRAQGYCECCEQKAPFKKLDGNPYLEIHHVLPLAQGGPDTVENAIACCANCHRELHFGVLSEQLKEGLFTRLGNVLVRH
ncbi:HNH endonuclease [Thalassospira povalilytica]|uniref:HNH endonuclease n=1 Tax=Thalassospira povalilytica TaxID=732237 RepID=UPI001D1944A1|nr:HNH endonuclease signature motif containing protein [Thalassospira povalilytica]MCC4242482.1 HNH endonuclease [Thalassospira povalilytica]